jgi:3-hydroxyacyl-CoA dehydrogenase
MSTYPREVKTVAVVGLGTIGMSWAAYFLARGISVRATDVDPTVEARTRAYIERARIALDRLGLVAASARSATISFHATVEEAADGCDFVQENGPESEAPKRKLLAQIDRATPSEVPIASSTSALSMTALQRECRFPRRCFVGHPFNPPHLIPLVELVGGSGTDPEVLGWAQDFYREIRRHPVRLQREVYGHIANRLQYVLFNEAARLVLEGVASVEDVDAAVAHGPGMRWAFFGPFMTMHLAGGTSGMTGAFQKFSGRDSTSDDRARRMPLKPDERQTLIDGVQVEAGGRSVAELEAHRDALLLELCRIKAALGGRTA